MPWAAPRRRNDLATTIGRIALLVAGTGQPGEAEAEYRAALTIRRKLVKDHPAVTEFRNGLAVIQTNLGVLLAATGRKREAEAEYGAAPGDPAEARRRSPRRHRIPERTGDCL